MRCKTILLACLFPIALLACGEPPDTRPGQPVTQRRAAFNKILQSFEPMGLQLRKSEYNATKFLVLAKSLVEVKEGPWSHFGPDTNYPPTHATAKVWSEPEEFETKRQAFLQAADRLLVAAETRDVRQVKVAYDGVHDTCRSCHKVFKD